MMCVPCPCVSLYIYVSVSSPCSPTGLTLTDHFFKVPLDYSDESKGQINLFVRVAVKQTHPDKTRLPSLLFLQGESSTMLAGGTSAQ